jgi:hypothetical protein
MNLFFSKHFSLSCFLKYILLIVELFTVDLTNAQNKFQRRHCCHSRGRNFNIKLILKNMLVLNNISRMSSACKDS